MSTQSPDGSTDGPAQRAGGERLRDLEILSYLAARGRPATLRDVTQDLQMSRTTTYRLLERLAEDRWLSATGRPRAYQLTLRVAELGLAVLRRNRVREDCVPFLVEGSQQLRGPCYLALYDGGDVLHLDAADMIGEKIKHFMLAARNPAAVTAAGKMLLSHQPEAEIERVLNAGLPRVTDYSITDPGEMREELERIRTRGIAIGNRELRQAWGVAGPVYDASANVVASIGTGFEGPMPDSIDEQIAIIELVCMRASAELGYRPVRRFLG